jgi:Delta7-sterol 5-desaturase
MPTIARTASIITTLPLTCESIVAITVGSMREEALPMPDLLARWPAIVAVEALRYAIPASIAFVVFWLWRWKALAHRRIQHRRPSRKALRREVRYSISTALIFSVVGLATFHLSRVGVLRKYEQLDSHGWAYWVVSIVLAILIHDAYFYWTHRAMHHPALFARFHRVHHLSTSPSPWAAYSFAPLEAVVSALVVPLTLLVLPMHDSAIFVFLIYMIVMNVIGHLGIELYPRWFARHRSTRWYSTSTHHNLHHRDFHGNYGLYFTWWDRICGTQHVDYLETFDAVTTRPRASTPVIVVGLTSQPLSLESFVVGSAPTMSTTNDRLGDNVGLDPNARSSAGSSAPPSSHCVESR